MIPKEKAKELVSSFEKLLPCEGNTTGQTPIDCALIAIDEVILFSENLGKKLFKELGGESYSSRCKNYDMKNYWQEVKKELEKL